ncbi:MAG: alpha/beta hydrolase [Anaerolineales bacterium]|jgi:pimeloyl-ACP methyl ester carboxylesterase
MNSDPPIIFLHGLVSSGQGFKGNLFRSIFPRALTPDFSGSLDERLTQLAPLLGGRSEWTIIGSSFGGLMATIFAAQCPNQVRKLLLLAPALILPEFDQLSNPSIEVPTVIFHGKRDTVIPLESLRPICERVFTDLIFNIVDDDHRLHKTVQSLDWRALVVKP